MKTRSVAFGELLKNHELQTSFVNGELILTSHRLAWSNKSIITSDLVLPLGLVVFAEEEEGGFMKTDKITLHLSPPPPSEY
jgi:hypothetical protein